MFDAAGARRADAKHDLPPLPGCDIGVRLICHEPHYGTLAHAFFDEHASCSGEIRITGGLSVPRQPATAPHAGHCELV